MKTMTNAQAYLRQIKLYDTHVNNKLEELQRLKTLATQITATIKPVPVSGSGGQDKLGGTIAKIIDLENEINDAIDTYIDKRREAGKLVDRVPDADQMRVLHKRYFEFKTWEQIARETNFSYRSVCYIHGRGLQAVDKILEDIENEQRTV